MGNDSEITIRITAQNLSQAALKAASADVVALATAAGGTRPTLDSMAKGMTSAGQAASSSGQMLAGMGASGRLAADALTETSRPLGPMMAGMNAAGQAASSSGLMLAGMGASGRAAAEALAASSTQAQAGAGLFSQLGGEVARTAAGFVSAQAIIGAVKMGVGALTDFVKSSVHAYAEQEAATVKMVAALRQHHLATPIVIQQYKDLSSEFQRHTVFADEVIQANEALLTQVGNLMPSQMRGALQASTDLAAGLGIDLQSATMLVAKAAAGHTETLGRYGITVSDAALKTQGFDAVLDAINRQFGGSAAAQLDTYSGKVAHMGNMWGEFEERVGEAVVKSSAGKAAMIGLTDASNELAKENGSLVTAFGSLVYSGFLLSNKWGREYLVTLDAVREGTQRLALVPSPFEKTLKSLDPLPGMLARGRSALEDWNKELEKQKKASKEAASAAEDHAKKLASAFRDYAASGATDWLSVMDKIGVSTYEGIAFDLKRGRSVGELALVYKTTESVVQQVVKAEAAYAESVKTLEAVHKLEHESLDGVVAAFGRLDDRETKAILKKQALADALKMVEQSIPGPVSGFGLMLTGIENVGRVSSVETDNILRHSKQIEDAAARDRAAVTLLADGFVRLGQVVGGVMGPILSDIGQMVVMLDQASKMTAQTGLDGHAIGGRFGAASVLLSSNASTLQKGAAGLAAGTAVAQGASDVWEATSAHESAAGNAGAGALAGAKAGAAFGPWGMAIGAAAGLIVGIVRGKPEWAKAAEEVGRDFGIKISDSLAKEIEQNEGLFGGRRVVAEMDAFSKIVAEGGGVTAGNFDKLAGKLRDVFPMMKMGWMDAAEGAKILDENWQSFVVAGTDGVGLINAKLTEMIKLDDEFGTKSKEIAGFIKGQLASAQQGFSTALGVTGAAYKALAADQQRAATETGDALDAVNADMKIQQGIIDATGLHSQSAASAVAASLTGIVASNMKAGESFIDAVRGIGPSVEALQAQLTATGFSGGAAFDFIKAEVALANDAIAGPALTAVEGYTQGLVGLSNAGLMNQDMFAGLAGQIGSTEQSLEAQGFTGSQVMLAMKGDLQTVWELEQKYGYKADDVTQALIDQGVQSGLIGEQGKSDNEKILDVLMAIGEALGATLPAGLKSFSQAGTEAAEQLQTELAKIPTSFDIGVNVNYNDPGYVPPDFGGAYGSMGGRVTASGIQYLGGGGRVLRMMPRGIDDQPAMLAIDEGVVNRTGMALLGDQGLSDLNHGRMPAGATREIVRETIVVAVAIDAATGAVITDKLTPGQQREVLAVTQRAFDDGKLRTQSRSIVRRGA